MSGNVIIQLRMLAPYIVNTCKTFQVNLVFSFNNLPVTLSYVGWQWKANATMMCKTGTNSQWTCRRQVHNKFRQQDYSKIKTHLLQTSEVFNRYSTLHSISLFWLAVGTITCGSTSTAPSGSSSMLSFRSSTYAWELTTWPLRSLCFRLPVNTRDGGYIRSWREIQAFTVYLVHKTRRRKD